MCLAIDINAIHANPCYEYILRLSTLLNHLALQYIDIDQHRCRSQKYADAYRRWELVRVTLASRRMVLSCRRFQTAEPGIRRGWKPYCLISTRAAIPF
jgi:hypothetical protein